MEVLADLDGRFDVQLPPRLRGKSSMHFTPVEVAQLAARMLAPRPGMRVLDVGAGAGKFCIVAAMELPDCEFVGIEQRPHLVKIANRLAKRAAVTNLRFLHGDAFELDWSQFDALYFFNPFAEQRHRPAMTIDATVDFSPETFERYVRQAHERLRSVRTGTRVVTYHGMGGDMPAGFDCVTEHRVQTDQVELWIKRRRR